jgi:Trypsin
VNNYYVCGCSIIADRVVLTAAHCLRYEKNIYNKTVSGKAYPPPRQSDDSLVLLSPKICNVVLQSLISVVCMYYYAGYCHSDCLDQAHDAGCH